MSELYQTSFLFKIKNTINEIAKKRGYTVDSTNDGENFRPSGKPSEYSVELNENAKEFFDCSYTKGRRVLYVILLSDGTGIPKKTSSNMIKDVIPIITTKEKDNFILLSDDKVQKSIETQFSRFKERVQFFSFEELSINILDSIFCNPMEIVKISDPEIKTYQKISISDPCIKYLGATPGDVVKFTRTDSNFICDIPGEKNVYRLVV
jgi:DNA-directed RNA polymerase subunit H (RpoH/RPB5)